MYQSSHAFLFRTFFTILSSFFIIFSSFTSLFTFTHATTLSFPSISSPHITRTNLPQWSNCTKHVFHQNYTVTGCDSISMLDSSAVTFRPYILDNSNNNNNKGNRSYDYYIVYQYFFDTKWYDVCDVGHVREIMDRYNVQSCEQLWCTNHQLNFNSNNDNDNDNRESLPQLLTTIDDNHEYENDNDDNGDDNDNDGSVDTVSTFPNQIVWQERHKLSKRYHPSFNVTQKDKDMVRLMNYCHYCKRRDFDSFHRNISNGDCQLSSTWRLLPDQTNAQFCQGVTHGIPLVFDRLAKYYAMPYMCHCSGGSFGYKCDAFSLILAPIITDVYPIGMSIVMMIMSIVNLWFYIVPFCIVRIKSLVRMSRDAWNRDDGPLTLRNKLAYVLNSFSDTYLLITLFMQLYFMFAIAENVVQYPLFHVNHYRRFAIGDGFFRATGLVWLLLSLFTLCTIWVHVMRIAQSISKQEVMQDQMPTDLKVVLVVIYVLFAILFAIPLFSLISAERYGRVVNNVYFPATCICSTVLAIVYATYGTKLYLKMRESRRMGLFEVKFTRFAAILIILLLLLDLQMIFVIIEWYKRNGPTFGIVYRSINFQLISISNLLIAASVMYQTFKSYLIYEAYPCLRCLSYARMKRIMLRETKAEESQLLLQQHGHR